MCEVVESGRKANAGMETKSKSHSDTDEQFSLNKDVLHRIIFSRDKRELQDKLV